ncbi:MAG: leukotoxin LktA family filamentous adhesin [Denitromonas halophila]|nr:MAG: leukotoxin LktA family filamentous adhesin [Denitromonas halophila]TVT70672.1 MAG: leukotoxin LktA family filamentous adhesin [Denitromonas halophila]
MRQHPTRRDAPTGRSTVSQGALTYLRRQYLCVLRRCAFLNAFSSWLLLAAPMAMAGQPGIVTDGRTATTLTQAGAVTDITTATVRGNNAFNSFSRFNIGSGQTVNLHLPQQTANLLNLVRNERSQIDGVMNAYKDGRIGGNVFFFNPHGMVVGAQGQINVGSLTVATPTPAYMERLIGPGGAIDDAAVDQALRGEIPLSESGLITVKGSVKAARAVQLAAANVSIVGGARIEAGAAAHAGFGALVNIDGLEAGAQMLQDGDTVRIVAADAVNIAGLVSADGATGEAAGRVRIDAGGDITVADGGRVSADGHGANSDGGKIRVWAEGTATLATQGELSARGGEISGDGGHIEFSATDTVRLEGGALKANATNGKRGSVLIDPNNIEAVTANTYTDGVDFTLIANDTITVENNITISTRDIANPTTGNHATDASQGDSGDLTLRASNVELKAGSRLLAHATPGHTGGDVKVEGRTLDAIGANRDVSASVTLTEATVTGKDITIRSSAETSLVQELLENNPALSVADAQRQIDQELDDPIDGIGGAFLSVTTKATATTTVLGSKVTGSGKVTISSHAGARSGFKKTATATTTIGDSGAIKSEIRGNEVDIASTATTSLVYKILGTATKLLDQSWLPDPDGPLITALDDNLFDFNSVPLVALSTAKATTLVDGASLIIGTDTVTIGADADSAAKPTFSSPFLFSAAWGESTAEARARVVGTANITATNALTVQAHTNTDVDVTATVNSINKPVDATFVRANTHITTIAEVGDSTTTTGRSISVDAQTEAEINAAADAKNTGGSGVGLSLAISETTSTTTATLGGTAEATTGDVSVTANADIEEGNSANAATLGNPSSISAKITNFKAGIQRNVVGGILTATGKINPATADRLTSFLFPGIKEGKFNAAGAVAWSTGNNTATASIAPLADVKAAGGISVTAKITDDPSSSAGAKTSSTGSAVGGSVAYGSFVNTANAFIGKGATVDAKGALLVDAQTHVPYPWQIDWEDPDEILNFLQGGVLDMFLTTYSINSAKGKSGIGLAVGVNLFDLDNNATAYIDEGAQINTRYTAIPGLATQSVKVSAKNDISLTGAVGILSKKFLGTSGGKAALGGSAGLISIDTNASATIRGNATVNSANAVNVDATNIQRVVTVTEAGGSSDAVGVEGAVSINTLTNTSTAAIDDDATVAAGDDITVNAKGDLENISVAGGVVATKGQVGIGFSVSVNTIVSDVAAYIGNFDPLGLDLVPALGNISTTGKVNLVAASEVSQGAYSVAGALATDSKAQTDMPAGASDTQDGAGSGSASKSGKGKFGVAVSADVSINDVKADTQAYVSDGATISAATALDLDATNTLALSALSGAVTISTQQSGNALAGSYAQNSLAGTTAAYADDATLTLTGPLTADAKTTGTIETLSASIAGTKGKVGVAGSVSINAIDNSTKTYLSNVLLTGVSTVGLTALDDSTIRAIAGAIAFGGKAGIGLSFSWNQLDNDTESWIANSDVDATGLVSVAATTDNSIDTISAAIGASKGPMAGAAAVTINTIDNTTKTWIAGTRGGDGVDSAANIALTSTDSSRIFGLAGALGATTGSAGVGVTFAWNDVDNIVDARLKNNANAESTAGDITVKADSSTHIEGISAAGGVSGKAGVAGAGTVVQANNTVKASIDAGSTAIADGNVHVAAADDVDLFSLAGNVAGGGKAGIGASASVLITNNTVEARIDGSATGRGKRGAIDVPTGDKNSAGTLLTESTRGVAVTATSHEDIETIAAGGSGGGSAGVAGSATVTDLTETTTAAIGSGATINPLDDGSSTQDVTVRASDETTLLGVAGAVAFGGSGGVGAGADVGLIGKTTTASVAGNVKTNDTVTVEARSEEDITSVAASLSVGGSAGIAGSASVYVVDVTTKSEIADGATVHSDGNVIVSADDDNEIDMIAGNGAFGGSAGVGASAAVAVLTKTTTARVGTGATVDALGTKTGVTIANGSFNAATYTANGTDEGEISAPAASNPDGSDSAALTGQRTASRGTTTGFQGLAVTATNKDDVETISATGAAAGSAAITLAGDVNVITTTTTAEIANNAQINQNNTGAGAGQSVLVGAGNDHYQMGIAGSASGAGAVGIGAAADVLVAKHTTTAKVGDSADIRARKDVSIEAHGQEEILSIAAGLGVGGTVGVAGSTSVLSLTNVTSATTGTGSVVDADGNVRIIATDDTETDVVDGTLAVGLGAAGVGGAVGVTRIEKDTTSGVGAGATVNARGNNTASMQALSGNDLSDRDAITGLMVEANSSEDLFSVAASGAGGFYAGVSGAVTVTSVDSDTTAVIGNGALINQGVTNGSSTQDVNVSAKNHAKLDAYTGSLAGGAVGAAGGVDVGTVKNDTTALIDNNAQVSAKRDVDVNALTSADIDSITVSASGGIGAIAGGVSVYSVGSGLDAEGRKKLKSDSGDFGDVNSYADDQASDGSINSLLAGSDDARIRDAGSQSQAARAGVSISGDLAGANTDGTTATIGDANVTTTTGAIDVDARQDVNIKVLAGGASVGGVGLGVGVGVVAVNAGTAADVAAQAMLDAGGAVSLTAHTKTVSDLTGFAGSYGGLAVDAALAFVTDNSTTRAALGDGVQIVDATSISVSASDDRTAESEAVGVSVSGGAAVGASVATATLGGSTTASAGDNLQVGQSVGTIDSLSITADSRNTAKAESIAGKAGIGLAASGSVATAKSTPTVSATIGDNSRITVAGLTDVAATGRSTADADAIGVNVAGGVGIGASVANATSAPDIDAAIGTGARITANQVRIAATQAILGGGTSAYALGAAGGLLAGVNATYAESNNEGKVDATLGDNSELTVANSVTVAATNNTRQRTDVTGVSIGGVLAAGATIGHANSDTETHASIGNGVQVASLGGLTGLISVTATGKDDNIATAVSGSGGLISGSAASVGTYSESNTSARLGSGDATHSLNASTVTLTADHTTQFNGKVDSVSASAVGASGSKARHTVKSTVEATVADNGRINANHVDIDANNRAHKFWWGASSVAADAATNADSAAWNIKSGSGGALNAAAGSSRSTVTLTTVARIGQNAQVHGLMPALGEGSFSMDAFNDVIGHDKSKLDSGGLVAVAATETHFTATGNATAEFGAGAQVTSDTGDITAGTRSRVDLDTRSSSDTYGLAGAPMGEAWSTWTGNNTAIVRSGARLLADQGGVHLGGGQASDGTRTDIEADSDVRLWNKTAFPINSDPDARTTVTSNASVQLLGTAAIETAGDITLAADKGKIDAHHVGIGKDIYREAASGIVSGISNAFGGDDVSFDIEGGETVVGGSSTAQIEGSALAGIHRFESLTLEYELVDASGNVVASPVTGTDGRVLWRLKVSKTDGVNYTIDPAVGLAANIQKRIDKLRSLMEQYSGDPVAVGAYESEIKFLQFKLVELGLASGDPNGTNFNTGNWNNPSPKEVKLEEIAQKEAQIDSLGNDIVSTTDGATTTTDGALTAQTTLTTDAGTVVLRADSINGNNATIQTNLAGMGNFNAADGDYLNLIGQQGTAASLRSDINTLQGQLSTDRTSLATSNANIDTLLGNIASRQSQIDTLLATNGAQSQIDALRALNDTDRSAATAELGTANSLLAGIATKSTLLDQKAGSLNSTYTTINSLQSTLRSRFANGSADSGRVAAVTNLQSSNTSLRGDVSTLAGSINGADATVAGASTTVAGNLTTVQGFETDLGTAQTDLVALEAQLPGLSDVPANGPIADFMHVDDITVRLGNIDVTADNLTGNGALRAPGDAKISIVNNTPDFLVLGKLTVDSDSGGEIRQNGFLINDNNEIRRINLNNQAPSLTLQTKHNNGAGLPQIEVISNYDPNSAKNANLPAPSPDIQLSDDVSNPLGLVRVYSQAGSIYVDGDIRAAQVDVQADNGDFVQSFVDGFYHSSGDPAANVQGGQTSTPAGKGIVANGSVFISARYLNINGLVQSGIETWNITLPTTPVLTGPASLYGLNQSALDTLVENWKNSTGPQYTTLAAAGGAVVFNAALNRIEANASYAHTDMGTSGWAQRTSSFGGLYPLISDYGNIGASYDPSVTGGRFVLDGEAVKGGYIQLYGQILNTAGSASRLKVLDGFGQIVVTNPTDRAVVVNNLSTGTDADGSGRGVRGVIDITDIQRVNTTNGTSDAIHTVITRENNTVMLDQTGRWEGSVFNPNYRFTGADITAADGRNTTYDPQTGLRYVWTTATDKSTNTYWQFSGTQFLGISALRTRPSGTVESKRGPYTTGTRRLDDGTYLLRDTSLTGTPLKTTSDTRTTSDYWTKTKEWTDCNWWTVCIAQDYHSKWTQSTGTQTITTFSLKADYPINVEFSGQDTGLVAINSKSDVILNGLINNRFGDTTITAGVNPGVGATSNPALVKAGQSILQGSEDALVTGQTLNFAASYSVGTTGSNANPVNIDLNGGTLNAAVASGNLALRQANGDLSIGIVSAGGAANAGLGQVLIAADGHLSMAGPLSSVTGNQIELVSENGSIGSATDPFRIKAGFTSNLAERRFYGVTAAARESIFLDSESWIGNLGADLLVSSITSTTGDVQVRTPGRIIDNNPFETRDERTYAQLLTLWEELSLLENTTKNAEKQQAAIAAFEAGASQEYRIYWQIRNQQADPSSFDANHTVALSTAQETAMRDSLAQQGKTQTEIDTLVRDYSKNKTDEYRALHEKLYATPVYENLIPVGYQDGFAYAATQTERDAQLKGSSWSEHELGIAFSPGLLKETTDTNPVLKDPNVAGTSVTLLADQGIGETGLTRMIDLSLNPGLISDDDKVALAAAERNDLSINGGIASVTQRKPVVVGGNGLLTVTDRAGNAVAGDVFLASETSVNVGAILSTGETRLKAAGSIMHGAGAGLPSFVASSLILESAKGDIGTATQPVLVQLGDNDPLIARADGDIFITQLGNDLAVDTLFSRAGIWLTAPGSIVDAFNTDDTNIRSQTLNLLAGGSLGSASNFLDIGLGPRLESDTDDTGYLTANAGTGAFLRSPTLPLILHQVDAGTEIRVIGGTNVVVEGAVTAPVSVDIAAGDDVRFDGGQIATDTVAISAGSDGTGNVAGSSTAGPDIVATTSAFITAPQGIGTGAPVEVRTPQLDLQADTMDVVAAPLTPAQPLMVNASGVGGSMASDVTLDLASGSSVTIGTLFANTSQTTATTPLFTVTDGQLGDYAAFYTPAFAIRVDHQNRAFQPGFDVRAFTLSGLYDMVVTPQSALIGAYIITKNPRKVVFSNPGGVADLRSRGQLNALDHQSKNDKSNRVAAGAAENYATAAGGLVFVDPDLFECGKPGEPNACEDL